MSKQDYVNKLNGFQKADLIEAITGISRLVISINLKTNLCAWFDISGHVSWLDIKITSNKTDYTTETVYQEKMIKYMVCNDDTPVKELIDKLLTVKLELKLLLSKHNNIRV